MPNIISQFVVNGPVTVAVYDPANFVYVEQQSMQPRIAVYDEHTPTVRRKKPVGGIFDTWTPFERRSYVCASTIGSWHVSWGSSTGIDSGTYQNLVGLGSFNMAWHGPSNFGQLEQKARLKIKSTKVNLAQVVGERKQTYNLLKGLASDILGAVRSIKRDFGASAMRQWARGSRSRKSRAISSRWLEYQYGWKPLMSDIHGAAEALAVRTRAGIWIYDQVSDSENWTVVTQRVLNTTQTEELHVRRKLRYRYKFQDSLLPELSALGITNPALLALELTPWSFVVDWVFSIGTFLDAFDALVGVADLNVARSYRKTNLISGICKPPEVIRELTLHGRVTITERLPLSGLLGNPFPSLQNPLARNGVVRSLNALALLRQQFR